MVAFNIARAIMMNRIGISQYPSFVTFIVTWRCNSRCIFCDIWKKKSDIQEELDAKNVESIFRQLKKFDVLRLTGGEPFLRNDLSEIINRIDLINSPEIIHITTNGFLTNKILKTMNEIDAAQKIHIKVSIDAIGEKHDRVRGIDGAYDKAMQTVRGLCELKKKREFHIGVNQAIINENEIESYFQLKDALAPYHVPVYPCIANDSLNSLYSDKTLVDPDISYKPYGIFSKEALVKFMKILIEDGKKVNNLQEQMIDRYHLKGLCNRIVEGKKVPNPRCVALSSHLRILPNGDVPVCLYNGKILGNLRKQDFRTIWFSEEARQQRMWVKECRGCWQSCESAVSAIYTGDIWRGLFY